MSRKRRRHSHIEATLRRRCAFLWTWYVCDNAACRRGRILACGDANFRRLPEDVQTWYLMLMEARRMNMPFEDAMAWLADTPVADAYPDWRDKVEAFVEAQVEAQVAARLEAPRP